MESRLPDKGVIFMSVLYIPRDDGTYEKVPVTPENTQRYIRSIPLYAEDDDPTFWSQDRIRAMQDELFKRQMEWVWDGHDYYRRVFAERGMEKGDIQTLDDLEKLPLTYKKEYMAEPDAFKLKPSNPTLYDWIFEVTYTTGSTTGVPTPFWNTIHDAHGIWQMIFRGIKLGGFPPYSRGINLFPLGPVPHIGFFRARDIGIMGLGSLNMFGCTGMTYPEFPVHRSMDYAIDLIEKGRATHPWLGFMGSTLSPDTARVYDLPVDKGAIVRRVIANSPADKAGLQAGDIIVAIDGAAVDSMDQVMLEVRKHQVGDEVTVDFYRGKEKKQAKAVLEEKPSSL